jgi:RNA polymerase-binding transcription factor
MAEKKTSKQKAKKEMRKTAKTPARKTPLKTKLTSVQKRKIVSGKPASQKSVPKKTSVKKNIRVKPVTKRKTGSPQKAAKKTSLKRKPKIPRKTVVPAGTPAPRKRAVQTSEEERKLALRRSLIQKREELVKEVKSEISKYIKGETRQLVDTALDDGDWSVVDLSEDISFKHMSTHRENLLKIDEALRKLSEGTYGICEDCGEQISEQRLKILPFAIYCTDCQERREQIEELEKREGLIG